MLPIDLPGETAQIVLCVAQAITATANQTGVDVKDFNGKIAVDVNIGAATAGTNPTMDIKIQDSPDNSSYADVSPAIAITQATGASAQTLSVDRRVVRRYIRAVTTIGGTASPSFPVSVTGRGQKHSMPATP